MVVRGQRTKIQNGQKMDKRFEYGGGVCSISKRVARLYNEGRQVGAVRGGSHSVPSRYAAGVGAPKVILAKSSEFGKGNL